MKMITKPQIKALHTILYQSGWCKRGDDEGKKELIYEFTQGRTTSSRELNYEEAGILLNRLNRYSPNNRMRRKVLALARQAGMIYGDTPEDHKMNQAKIDLFLKARGAVKKPLNQLNKKELTKVVTQFELINKKGLDKEAQRSVDELLRSCGLTVTQTKGNNTSKS